MGLAAALQVKPFGPKNLVRPDGIPFDPPCFGNGTTMNRLRVNSLVKPGFTTGLPFFGSGNGLVGAVPLTLSRTMEPWVSQPNWFCVLLGLQVLPLTGLQKWFRHLAEW